MMNHMNLLSLKINITKYKFVSFKTVHGLHET